MDVLGNMMYKKDPKEPKIEGSAKKNSNARPQKDIRWNTTNLDSFIRHTFGSKSTSGLWLLVWLVVSNITKYFTLNLYYFCCILIVV